MTTCTELIGDVTYNSPKELIWHKLVDMQRELSISIRTLETNNILRGHLIACSICKTEICYDEYSKQYNRCNCAYITHCYSCCKLPVVNCGICKYYMNNCMKSLLPISDIRNVILNYI